MQSAMARYRNLASEAGVQLTPEMEKTLERIQHSRGSESAGQTIQDMIGNLKQGNTQVNRGTTTTTSSTPKPTTTTTTPAKTSTPTPQQRINATAEVVSPSSGGQRAANMLGGLATAVGLGIPAGQMLNNYVTTPYLNKNYPTGGSYTVKDGKTYDSQGNVVDLPPYNK
jgi:phage tail tape-measure protein